MSITVVQRCFDIKIFYRSRADNATSLYDCKLDLRERSDVYSRDKAAKKIKFRNSLRIQWPVLNEFKGYGGYLLAIELPGCVNIFKPDTLYTLNGFEFVDMFFPCTVSVVAGLQIT